MEASGIAKKIHLIALKTHPINKCRHSVKPKNHLFCKSSLIILSRFYSASPTLQRWPRPYRFTNACCCSKDINSFAVEADTDVGHDRTVRVKLILQKECEFGEGFCVVGEEPILGSWNPQLAIHMTWSSGHIWTTPIMDIPLGKRIYFKFILRDKEGEFHWQPGPDRVFEPWETRTILLVSQDWYDFDLQTITEAKTEEEAIIETLGETEIEDQTQEAFEETRAGIVESEEITREVPILIPGLAPISYTDEIASRETLGETESEDQVVEATQEAFPEIRDRIVERGQINGGVPVLVPGLASISCTAEDCSSTGGVPGAKNVSTVDIDCSAKDVEYPRESPLAISATQEIEIQQEYPGESPLAISATQDIEKQQEYPGESPLVISATQEIEKQQQQEHQRQYSSSYAENGSVLCKNHASVSGKDDALPLGTTEEFITVENEETSIAKELNENKDKGASSESSRNEQENFSAYESEPDSSVLQKDFDWGRAALSKLIWSLGLKND